MSALAFLLHRCGAKVSGSDGKENGFTKKLVSQGIPVSIGDSEEILAENVVYTEAIDSQHRQLQAAKSAGKRIFSRAKLLGRLAEEYPSVLSVAGCHGKTSTTSMLAHIFYCAGRAFTSHIGGEDTDFGNFFVSQGGCGEECFVTEACEFRRSFLSLKSTVALVLNTDKDHTDCYKTDGELVTAYRAFAANAQKVVVNADDLNARDFPHAISFGLYSGDVRGEKLHAEGEKYTFTVSERGIPTVRIRLNVVGKYQVMNALGAYAAAKLLGFSPEEIKRGLEHFRGVKRRFEKVGTICGVPVVCDYAHHPHEISAAYSAAEMLSSGTVRLVFQPHTFTRTRDFMREFVRILKRAESPIIYRTYSAREPFEFDGSAVALVSRIPEAVYVQSPEQLKKRLSECVGKGDLVLILGAGDIYDTALGILDRK